MKRETKKVKKPVKRVRKPAAKPVEEVKFIWHPQVALAQPKIDVKFPEVWNEEVARAAKVLGVDPLEVITKLMAFLPKHYSNHLRMLEAIVEHESDHGNEKIRLQEEMLAHSRDAEIRRVKNLVEEIQRRREIIEPNTAFAERETIVRETSYLNPRHGVGYCKS